MRFTMKSAWGCCFTSTKCMARCESVVNNSKNEPTWTLQREGAHSTGVHAVLAIRKAYALHNVAVHLYVR